MISSWIIAYFIILPMHRNMIFKRGYSQCLISVTSPGQRLALAQTIQLYRIFITKTRPCNIQQYFTAVKMIIFRWVFLYIFLNFAQTLIVGTRYNRLTEAVLTSTHNLCFRAKIRKNVYPCKPQFYYIKVGCKGVFVTRTCFRDVIQSGLPSHATIMTRF